MREILPKALLLGFTGTPLLSRDKKTSIEMFSPGYIHTYKYNEAVADGVVLDLRYEARDVDQMITQQARIDDYFQIKTVGLNDAAKAKLKSKWAKMQILYSSHDRLEVIAKDIMEDFDLKPRLMDGNGNAMLVADEIYTACRYYEVLQSRGFRKCAIITSFVPLESNLRTEAEDAEEFKKYEVYKEMLGFQNPEDFEAEAKRKFIEEPAQMKLLIVVDKLLTGFDAPPCTYLYIDKSMQDHGLFQAICRVNRLDGDSKQFGHIVDYKQLFGYLTGALQKYTSGAFEGYDATDIEGMLNDRTEEAEKQLIQTLEELDDLCGGVPTPREEIQYLHYFCGESGVGGLDDESYARSREKLYRLTNKMIRCFAEFKSDITSSHIVDLCAWVEPKVSFYIALKETIGNASGDFIDLKSYEKDMRRLIDTYIRAEDSRKIGEFDDFTLLDFVEAHAENLEGNNRESAAEVIENNIRRKVVEKILINPLYYENMSAILDDLIRKRREGAIAYEHMLEHYVDLVKKSENPENNTRYPDSIRHSGAMRAFYDNCGEDEDLAKALHKAVLDSKEDQFRHNEFKERRIKKALLNILGNKEEVERIYSIVVEQGEY
jgi:type I restriction enzyme R subunit